MGRRPSSGPTDAELEILQALWTLGPSSVRDVNEAVNLIRPTGYTTTLKHMQLMIEKGLLTRDEEARPHLYRPGVSREKTQRKLVRDLLKRAFDGSATQLIQQALSTQEASEEDLTEIRQLLDEIEEDRK